MIIKYGKQVILFALILIGFNAIGQTKLDRDGEKAKTVKSIAVFNPNVNNNNMTDQVGNIYKTVKIGNQIWMAENLRTTKYNDGTPIENISEVKPWVAAKSGAYCWYENNKANAIREKFGALYNWYAVKSEKLCPTGWHVPSKDEWITLANAVNKEKAPLKSTTGWFKDEYNEGNGNNKYGFSAIPAPSRTYKYGVFGKEGIKALFWTTTTKDYLKDQAFSFIINNSSGPINISYQVKNHKYDGLSVRCIRKDSNASKNIVIEKNSFFNIKNRWKGTSINIENALAVGEVAPGWHSALWIFEPVEGTKYVKIKNRWKGTYLNLENGFGCGEIAPGWHSAMWEIVPVEGANYVKIKNRWKGTYINIENGLNCTEIAPGWHSAMWEIDYNVPE